MEALLNVFIVFVLCSEFSLCKYANIHSHITKRIKRKAYKKRE